MKDFRAAIEVSKHVIYDLIQAGFIYNMEKSHWIPSTSCDWLGMTWDTSSGTLKVFQRRVDKICQSIDEIQRMETNRIRQLHSFVGQIISLGPVCGNISRLMTRHCQIEIARADHEDKVICLDEFCKNEINLWKVNVSILNVRHIFSAENVNHISCCDVSSIGTGAIICNDVHTAHKQWTEMEAQKSSTWREVETIYFAVCSFLPIISNSCLRIYTVSLQLK